MTCVCTTGGKTRAERVYCVAFFLIKNSEEDVHVFHYGKYERFVLLHHVWYMHALFPVNPPVSGYAI